MERSDCLLVSCGRDILGLILSYLKWKELINASLTCRYLREVVINNDHFWHQATLDYFQVDYSFNALGSKRELFEKRLKRDELQLDRCELWRKQLDNFKDWQTYFKNKVAQSIQILNVLC